MEIEQLTPTDYLRRVDDGEYWQLLDVREAWETELASVTDSIRIPMAEIPARRSELDAGTPIAVICYSGVRSQRVAVFLAEHGFEPVANIAGGIDAWSVEVDASIPRY